MIILKKVATKVALLALVISLALPFSGAFSSTSAKTSTATKPAATELDQLKAALEYASKEEKAELQKYISIQTERKKADDELAGINKKIANAEAREKAAREQAAAARAEYAASQAKLDSAILQSDTASQLRKEAIVKLYHNSSSNGEDSIITAAPEDKPSIVRLSLLMKNYTAQQANLIVDASAKREDAEIEKEVFKDAQTRAEEAEKIAKEEADSLVPLRQEAADKQKEVKAKEDEANKVVQSLKSKKAAYTKQINQIIAESNALAKKIKEEQQKNNNGSGTTTPPAPGNMIKPINSAITSPFGYRTHPIYGDQRLHAGIDLKASTGTPVKAAKAGKVISVTVLSGYGNVVIIDHGGGISTLYAHLNSFAVSNGATVPQGQVIGYSGMSGNVTGPHLHWEVRSNGTPVNPMNYL